MAQPTVKRPAATGKPTIVAPTGKLAAIGSIADAGALVRGEAGTIVTRDAAGIELAEVA